MNLKEAFRFQNRLGSLMEEAQGILSRDANITRVENTYLRKKVFDGAENETVVDTPPTDSEQEAVVAAALEVEKVKKATEGMQVVKTILVKNKLVNLIVKPAK